MSIKEEIERRRTFAIISHPDAGKTTLTEKFLLFGGAIQTAGAVKSNKIKNHAASDFMEIERQRGISVATSVMGFEYRGYKINLLDTPGHKDFAEDTYRTLTAVDSVILVVDCVKGVEEQTQRLMEVCRMRNTPVMIFVNKLDRPGKDPFDLLDELETKLNIKVRPLSWPINMGSDFKGVYNLYRQHLDLFSANKTSIETNIVAIDSLDSPTLDEVIGRDADELREGVALVEGVYEPFEVEAYREAHLAPVFFGSALNNFGIRELLDTFVEIAPPPGPKITGSRTVSADEEGFSGFVFKIHANLDARHRDRIAFLRVCSGRFQRNKLYHHVRLGKSLRFNNPYSFLGNEKNVTDDALPGDVVGLYDTNNFKIGDTLSEGEVMMFKGIPSFSPEIFREVVNANPLKTKQLEKGISQLTDEGVAQLFTLQPGNRKIIGTVGELQFDVIRFRLEGEYGASCNLYPLPIHKACWLTSDNPQKLREFMQRKGNHIAYDKDERPVYLSESEYMLTSAMRQYPEIQFHFISEHSQETA
ncbi:MAG: peptide chain release factor 3 [Cytophagales bacterium]|nr:peptide chain release factor 3 [Cytophagales bacterium]